MREVVLDTETTGLDPKSGHRIVEIGCLELLNHMPTGKSFHKYVNPERSMPSDAFEVHGLSEEFLADQPLFADIAAEFVSFISDSPLVIHNARFDIGFLNAEFDRIDMPHIADGRAVDTVEMARRKFPGAPANLDALCRRFNIDNTGRALHGALLDSGLLAEVYLELIGGRQPGLGLARREAVAVDDAPVVDKARAPRRHAPGEAELAAHDTFLESIEDPVWRR